MFNNFIKSHYDSIMTALMMILLIGLLALTTNNMAIRPYAIAAFCTPVFAGVLLQLYVLLFGIKVKRIPAGY